MCDRKINFVLSECGTDYEPKAQFGLMCATSMGYNLGNKFKSEALFFNLDSLCYLGLELISVICHIIFDSLAIDTQSLQAKLRWLCISQCATSWWGFSLFTIANHTHCLFWCELRDIVRTVLQPIRSSISFRSILSSLLVFLSGIVNVPLEKHMAASHSHPKCGFLNIWCRNKLRFYSLLPLHYISKNEISEKYFCINVPQTKYDASD